MQHLSSERSLEKNTSPCEIESDQKTSLNDILTVPETLAEVPLLSTPRELWAICCFFFRYSGKD